jgi:hypothetical protein
MGAIISGIVGGITTFLLLWGQRYLERRKVRHLIQALNDAQTKRNYRNN